LIVIFSSAGLLATRNAVLGGITPSYHHPLGWSQEGSIACASPEAQPSG
jgi:hypothetical protein